MPGQKQIAVKVMEINDEKRRKKAMTTAGAMKGVYSVSIEGERRDKVVVVADDGVDSAKLEKKLKKELGDARLDTMQNVTPQDDLVDKFMAGIHLARGLFGRRRTQASTT